MVVALVMHKFMLLQFSGLDGEHVTWVVGLVLMPLGHPGGGLEGETCKGSFGSVVMWMQVLAPTHYPHLLWKGG